jgi:superfamily I DNA/RNA helicase
MGVITDAVKWAKVLWKKMSNPKGDFPSSHDVYLRLYAESAPKIAADYILFDEAQDADALMLHVLLNQKCPVIFVGDRWQQIYAWRGAVNAMSKIQTEDVAQLTTSFRFGQAIADRASKVLRTMGETVSIRGFAEKDSKIMRIAKYPHAVIARTNAEAAAVIFEHEKKSVATTGLNEAVDFFKAYVALRDKKRVPMAYRFFKSLTELKSYANDSDEGADLKPYFKLLSKREPEAVLDRLSRLTAYSPKVNVDLVVSTAHKCKGLEFPRVQLRGDFLPLGRDKESGKTRPPAEEEVRLLYVALTRASEVLDDSLVPWDRLRLEFPVTEAEAAPVTEAQDADEGPFGREAAYFNLLHEVWSEQPSDVAWRMIDLFFMAKSEEAYTPKSLAHRWGISEAKAEVLLMGLKGKLAQRNLLNDA